MFKDDEKGFLAGVSCGMLVFLAILALGALLAWITGK